MINTNVTNFRKQLFELVNQTIKYNEPVNIATKNGNAVLISEDEYNSLMETLYLINIPGMKETLEKGINTPIEECDDFEW
ncbi:MAG: type II toxin-antitoxin system Phd/YefM family antitoxin [Clostridia bacterium]|nr:type II toxin-antitoxin system Phd/YefM family antitoxin [Clostridia bacterium]